MLVNAPHAISNDPFSCTANVLLLLLLLLCGFRVFVFADNGVGFFCSASVRLCRNMDNYFDNRTMGMCV